jgi:hypothetical protein
MRKIIALGAVMALSVPAFAQMDGGVILTNPEFANGFSNRGQCESALAHVRNDQRRNPDTRGSGYEDLSTSDFQRESRTTTRCEQIDGDYQVVFYVDGIPQ